MEIELDIDQNTSSRLCAVAEHRGVSPEALAVAYVEDWLNIEYAELKGRLSRRGNDRDGPIAFDKQAAVAAARIEDNLRRMEGRD